MNGAPADDLWGHRILARPADAPADLLAAMDATLARRDFDPNTMFLDPHFTRQHAARAVRLRLSVLLRTYRGEYHTDSFEQDRLVEQIRRGDEFIWFWGSTEQIAAARAELARPEIAPMPDLAVGTVTVLSVEHEFGPGHGELCRSGSMDRSVGAVAAILHRMIGYHRGRDREVHDRFHTLLLAARNRATTTTVRGGEAVQHIHCQYVRSRFWGILPFYVMQGDVIECTELRESYRDAQDARDGLAAGAWCFADVADARYAEALWRLNFSALLDTQVVTGVGSAPGTAASEVLRPPNPDLVQANHVTVRPAGAQDAGVPWRDAVLRAEDVGACSVAVHIPLTDIVRVPDQAWLAGRGYVLTAISPPKRSWQIRDGRRHSTACEPTGVWCRPRPGLPVVVPYYLTRGELDDAEEAVLAELRPRLLRIGAGDDPTAR